MNTEEIQKRINEILADERISYKSANLYTNGPLVVIQTSLATELHTLQRVLGVELTDIHKLRGEDFK